MSAVQPDSGGRKDDAKNIIISLLFFAAAVGVYMAASGSEPDTASIRPE